MAAFASLLLLSTISQTAYAEGSAMTPGTDASQAQLADAAMVPDVPVPQPTVPVYTAPPPPVTTKKIVVSLSQERLTAYDNGAIYLQVPVTSGGPNTPTPVGVYSVLAKRANWTMKSPWPKPDPRWYPDSWINYSVLFESSGYFIHDASWRNVYGLGSNLLPTAGTGWLGTHGCVNVPLQTEAALYFWAPLGTPVIVQA
jgi:lipoprotein-anchoring transpeptidase ErfK/SrfK